MYNICLIFFPIIIFIANRFPQVVAQALGTSVAFAKIALYFAEPHYSKQKLLMYIVGFLVKIFGLDYI